MSEPQFVAFNSAEEMFEFMRKGEEYGNRNLHPVQAAITWGSHWVRFYDVANRLVIFGQVMTEEEAEEAEYRGIESSIDDEAEREAHRQEAAESMRIIRDSHERGLMWGWAYSKGEHDLGSTHRFNMWPISVDLYNAVKAVGWDVDALEDPARRAELEGAWHAYRLHALAVRATGDQP